MAPLEPLPSWHLTPRQLCDLELIGAGAFAPLTTFLGRADYESVCDSMRLCSGALWPVPVTLDLPSDTVRAATRTGGLVLTDAGRRVLAVLTITEAWRPDRMAEARAVLGTDDPAHPSVVHLQSATHQWYVTGDLEMRGEIRHDDLPPLVRTPHDVRTEIQRRGWRTVVAFNTRNPMHGAHRALLLRALANSDAAVLLHPAVGPTRPGDVPPAARARSYLAVMKSLPARRSMLALLPLAMRMAGPREALWHAVIRRTFGATHFVVGRDQASPGSDSRGRPFYPQYAAQDLVRAYEAELGLRALCLPELVYVEGHGYLSRDEVPSGGVARTVSGTQLRELLTRGADVPHWLAAPDVVAELAGAFTGSVAGA